MCTRNPHASYVIISQQMYRSTYMHLYTCICIRLFLKSMKRRGKNPKRKNGCKRGREEKRNGNANGSERRKGVKNNQQTWRKQKQKYASPQHKSLHRFKAVSLPEVLRMFFGSKKCRLGPRKLTRAIPAIVPRDWCKGWVSQAQP